MQVCAFDEKGELIRASAALRQCDYVCVECGRVVHLRKGMYRQAHFYHVEPNQACRMAGKGLVHLSVQHHVLENLPSGEAEMEHRFESINRIADVAWISQKIVFEVQCSPITAEEVLARNGAYASLGMSVVWILHANRYNQERMTSAEDVLRTHAHYFTDIDEEGKGHIYDQYSLAKKGMRIFRLPPFPISIAKPFAVQERKAKIVVEGVPRQFFNRYSNWTHGFAGDYIASLHEKHESHGDLLKSFQHLPTHEEEDENSSLSVVMLHYLKKWIMQPYQVLFRALLERTSR